MDRLLTRYDETGVSNPCLCGILVVSEEDNHETTDDHY